MDHGSHPLDLPLWSCRFESHSRLRVTTRAELERRLVTRAYREPAFRRRLVSAPKPLVEAELGFVLPDTLKLELLQETEETHYIVIPTNPFPRAGSGIWFLEEAAATVLEGRRLSRLDTADARRLLVRVWSDDAFRERLLITPAQLLEDDFGLRFGSAAIHVREEKIDSLFIVLPWLSDYDWDDNREIVEFTSVVNQPLIIGSQQNLTFSTCTPRECSIYTRLPCR